MKLGEYLKLIKKHIYNSNKNSINNNKNNNTSYLTHPTDWSVQSVTT
jgi:hypothetical protein